MPRPRSRSRILRMISTGHRRGADGAGPERAEIVAAEGGMAEDGDEHRRHAGEDRDPLGLDEPHRLGRVEDVHDHLGGADEAVGGDAAHASRRCGSTAPARGSGPATSSRGGPCTRGTCSRCCRATGGTPSARRWSPRCRASRRRHPALTRDPIEGARRRSRSQALDLGPGAAAGRDVVAQHDDVAERGTAARSRSGRQAGRSRGRSRRGSRGSRRPRRRSGPAG